MPDPKHIRPDDIRGVGQMVIAATLGITNVVEAMHSTIIRTPGIVGNPVEQPTPGLTGFIYRAIRTITTLVGNSIDAVTLPLIELTPESTPSDEREAVIAAINGVLGDYLQTSGNPLALTMQMRMAGEVLALENAATTLPQTSGKIVLLVHGLCLNDQHWEQAGYDYGTLLADELGYTPVYLRYNTGLHISTNGQRLAELLEALSATWPVTIEELVIVAHSMGGLVSRSACYYATDANHVWLGHLRKIVFLGTPHHGSPLEQMGNWIDTLLQISPYSAAFARLGKIRSAGITDLRYGNLLDADWMHRDRFAPLGDPRQAISFPPNVACHLIAASTRSSDDERGDHLLGDGLVPLDSALGKHPNPTMELTSAATATWIGYAMNHLDLLHQPDVYAQLRQWLAS